MPKRITFILILTTVFTFCGYGQEINFSKFKDYTLNPTILNSDGLKFGQVVSTNSSSTYSVNIGNASIISFEGVKYLDVIVEITTLLSTCTYPMSDLNFNLSVAYDNSGGDQPRVEKARVITNISSDNSTTFRIPILNRQNLPPGPPPTPPTNNFEQSLVNSTFYLFFYGNITVGDLPAGSYCSEISVNVNYD